MQRTLAQLSLQLLIPAVPAAVHHLHCPAAPFSVLRYEEPGSHKIQSFPRVIEDSVRRPDERRQRQRQAKAERKAAEQETREAELRRLKNLKQEEINDM